MKKIIQVVFVMCFFVIGFLEGKKFHRAFDRVNFKDRVPYAADNNKIFLYNAVSEGDTLPFRVMSQRRIRPYVNLLYDKKTLLIMAIDQNNIKLVNALIKNGADVNKIDGNGDLPLNIAILKESVDIAVLLIEKGALLDKVDSNGYNAIDIDCSQNGMVFDRVKIKLRVQNQIKLVEMINKTQLEYAFNIQNSDLLERHLTNGADVNFKYDLGRTLLHRAVINRDEDMVRCLYENNASLDLQDNEGLRPIDYAVGDDEFAQNVRDLFAGDN